MVGYTFDYLLKELTRYPMYYTFDYLLKELTRYPMYVVMQTGPATKKPEKVLAHTFGLSPAQEQIPQTQLSPGRVSSNRQSPYLQLRRNTWHLLRHVRKRYGSKDY